jgi:tetratricopeptide (TPR) repeat protein|tara:strand:- start:42061 stop:42645 length:585 start_codon:yes stop_codon:yes gene_type:complete
MSLKSILEAIFEFKEDPEKEELILFPRELFDDVESTSGLEATRLNREGAQQYGAGKYNEALKLFNRAVKIEPDNAFFWTNKGKAHRELGETEDAIKALEKGIEYNKEKELEGQFFYRIASVYFRIENYKKAAEYYEKINFKEYLSYEMRLRYSYCCLILKRYNEAIKYAEEAGLIRPSEKLPKEIKTEAEKRAN